MPSRDVISIKESTMRSTTQKLVGLSHVWSVRGGLMLTLGTFAAAWPESILVPALLAVGVICELAGLYQVGVALSLRSRVACWLLALVDGLMAIAFGLLTVGVAAPELRWTLVLISTWLLCYAAVAWRATTWLPHTSPARRGGFVWVYINAALGILIVSYPGTTIFVVLYLGAVYAAIQGAWYLAVGIYLYRTLGPDQRSNARATPHSPAKRRS
jgi:uncharacterized membrane protein HdeD (DUF308 family)